MDGIAGIVYSDVFQISNFIEPMLNTMAHRGHTIQDIHTVKNVQLGSCGQKVVYNPEKTIYTSIDGLITNNQELQKKLRSLGHSFTTEHPLETLIVAYTAWGVDCFSKLEGDYAIMLFDLELEKAFLVRDRIGKKPLYWYQDEHHFIFASELKALLATGIVPQSLARDGIASYLYFGYIPQDVTPVKNVSKLLPAHYLEYNFSGTKYIRSYWSYSSQFKNIKEEPKKIAENLNTLLTYSVELNRSFAEKKDPHCLGCFVSGGLGSASVAYYLRNSPTTCFTVGFKEENEEDTKTAAEVAQTLKLPHKTKMIDSEHSLDSLVKIIWHLDEPLADPNILATWEISKLANKETSSVFSGMGSDELLAGHSRYTTEEQKLSLWQKFKQCQASCTTYLLLPFLKLLWKSAALSLLKKLKSHPFQFHYLNQNALFTKSQLSSAAPKLKDRFDPETFLRKFQKLSRFKSKVASYLYFDVKTRLPDRYILQYERLTAAHGLDFYTPFLDRNIVEYMASVFEPDDLKGTETAAYLKEIMRKVFPGEIVDRPKENRPHFLSTWIKEPQIREVFELLKEGLLVENGIISKKWIQDALWGKNVCNDTFQCLWSILVLEIWYRLFINHPITSSAPDLTVKELLLKRH